MADKLIPEEDGAYTLDEVKAILHISTSSVLGMLRANVIPHTVLDGKCTIQKGTFDQWWSLLQHDTDECHR